ncbi:helix-turn-helix transcriptional regulator [Actinoplanes sp. LDG1-06]|uniref:Helix-turn-helix transcriptional regulator n=1 Tax=Paractinoplanes ovalisporus TaxID=2810368 RepID=A0ABS2AHX4_9ACTN|nr:AraC family transcriptional regulator [Actinoplanes ovalisporus]MBM2619453.1 helix-turn-helix transcriptional regulator [Actinoplanes ovalisporus]
MTSLGGGPGRPMRDSAGLGWRLADAAKVEDPRQLDSFAGAPATRLTMVLVTAGRYRIESRHGRGWRRADYAPGSVGLTTPGWNNVLRWRSSGQEPLESLHLRIGPAAVHETLDAFGVPHDDLAGLNTLTVDDPYVSASLSALDQALDQRAPGLYADAVAESVVVHLVHRRLAGPAQRSRIVRDAGALGDRDMRLVLDHMQAHLGDDLDLETLAGLVHLSKHHFLRMFTRASGQTPHRRLIQIRLQHAAALLRTSRMTVRQVAMVCGYRSPSQFAAAFQRHYGVSPSTYRR